MNSFLCLLALSVSTVQLAEGNQTATKTDTGNSYVRGCYYTNWAQYRPGKGKFVPENYVPGLCTHIFYAFVTMTNNFELKAFEWNDEDTSGSIGSYHKVYDLKQQQPDLKILLSFGGYTFSQSNAALLSSMASTSVNRAKFINSVVSYVRRINFDGFDIDWEYPGSKDKINFATLIQEMRAAFENDAKSSGKPRLLLTAAVPAGKSNIDAGYDAQQLGRDFDYVNIMSYDFHGSWESKTGFNSPLYDRNNDQLAISLAADYWTEIGVPKSKLIIGLGTYGRGWRLADPDNKGVGAPTSGIAPSMQYTNEGGMASYYEICELIEQKGYQEFYDETQQSPYIVGDNNQVWIGYDNVKSFNIKLDWIKENEYAGVFVWALDFDDFQGQCKSSNGQKYPLLSAIKAKLGGKVKPPGPGSRTTLAQRLKPTRPTLRPTQPQTFRTQEPRPTLIPGGAFQCPKDGIFPDPTSCKGFYICAHLNANKMFCPPNLLFNEQAQYCDWADNVKCTKP